MTEYRFRKAVAVWERGRDCEMNYNLIFRTVIGKNNNTIIALSAASMYQMFVNGNLVSEGPAKAGHGWNRVDEIDVTPYLTEEKNVVVCYVDGYYVKNFYLIKQPSFFCAEIITNGEVTGYTGDGKTFEAKYHSGRLQKAARFSFQRTFAEYYTFDKDYLKIETDPDYAITPVKLVPCGKKKYITRGVPHPSYAWVDTDKLISRGRFVMAPAPEKPQGKSKANENRNGFESYEDYEIEAVNNDELGRCNCTPYSLKEECPYNTIIGADEYAVFSLKGERTGFITLDIEAEKDSKILVLYDEISSDNDIPSVRLPIQSAVIWNIEAGKYRLMANEPNSFKFIKVYNHSEGAVKLNKIGLHEYEFDYKAEELNSGNESLDRIYAAAVENFRQNTIDVYMDCPSRERAGWLCDSFFTSRTEYALTGKSVVEKNFLENFIMQEGFHDIDERMIPMCYPSDHCDGNYIPNWAMWYVVELGEYYKRSGDKELIDKAENRLYRLYDFFKAYENSDGLLEKLDRWVFLEWSKANEFVQDVNYPSNMLYAVMLRTMAELYGDNELAVKSEKILATIREQSYFNGFFHDHAIRHENGELEVMKDDVTETCQYYAFFTKAATPEMYPELWKILRDDFGADRVEKGRYPEIYPANAFIGYYLRLDILADAGEKDTVIENIIGFFDKMALKTGTLWENNTDYASCNHGFASHVIVWLHKFIKNV